ncbi:hypothetical protein IU433_20380 [Nocardia puris]|uniref:Uncharacterized protein n=1 Tax=Nocardia puris TaxID=208602 RepID=A0A366E234_9NOCA|nr:DUF6204 family protein [Nocardia puris]MBF6212802.1 hypothetical protein [Nocardia puris]MBF6367737.1 hypothetical protein [Nocardia puris]MBF6461388.1 hypothetical protein [Nocardia puris]RBO96372.1 hypothetical protein DFR74_101387 [Nocardia puris]
MNRTYRVTVCGRFANLDAAQRDRLRAEQDAHDMFAARFTPEGTFLYSPELIGYQFRYLLQVADESPEDAEVIARLRAEELAGAGMRERGLDGRIVDITVTCVEDMQSRARMRR